MAAQGASSGGSGDSENSDEYSLSLAIAVSMKQSKEPRLGLLGAFSVHLKNIGPEGSDEIFSRRMASYDRDSVFAYSILFGLEVAKNNAYSSIVLKSSLATKAIKRRIGGYVHDRVKHQDVWRKIIAIARDHKVVCIKENCDTLQKEAKAAIDDSTVPELDLDDNQNLILQEVERDFKKIYEIKYTKRENMTWETLATGTESSEIHQSLAQKLDNILEMYRKNGNLAIAAVSVAYKNSEEELYLKGGLLLKSGEKVTCNPKTKYSDGAIFTSSIADRHVRGGLVVHFGDKLNEMYETLQVKNVSDMENHHSEVNLIYALKKSKTLIEDLLDGIESDTNVIKIFIDICSDRQPCTNCLSKLTLLQNYKDVQKRLFYTVPYLRDVPLQIRMSFRRLHVSEKPDFPTKAYHFLTMPTPFPLTYGW